VVIYQPAIQQAFLTTRQGTANKNKSLNFLSLGYGEAAGQLKDRYNITVIGDDPINGRPATMVQLDPRASNDGVKAIQLWIDNQTWLPVQYHLLEKGARTIITLGGMKPNVALSDNKFEIDLPKNVKVVKG
jgi:outer membrane lipoprotein-sorting protein